MNTDETSRFLLENGRYLRSLAFALVRDAHAADDVVQDTWISWARRPEAPVRSPRAWFARAIRNTSFNHRRAARRRADAELLGARTSPSATPADDAARADLLRRLVEAVHELDEPYRGTLLARYFRGLDAKALAAESRTPLATVRSREQRGLEMLRERLDRGHGGRGAWAVVFVRLLTEGETAIVARRASPTLTKTILIAATLGAIWTAYRLWEVRKLMDLEPLAMESASDSGASSIAAVGTALVDPGADANARTAGGRRTSSEPTATVAQPPPARRGIVVDTEGRPLAGAALLFRRFPIGVTTLPPVEVSSDRDGTFALDYDGPFRVEARLAGHRFLRVADCADDASDGEHMLRVTLAALATIAVTVVDSTGRPLEGVTIAVTPGERSEAEAGWDTVHAAEPATATTDAGGRVEFPEVWAGVRMGVFVQSEEGSFGARTHVRGVLELGDEERGEPIVVAGSERLELEARLGYVVRVEGEVTLPDGAPASDYTVHLRDLGAPGASVTEVLTSAAFTDSSYSIRARVPRVFGPLEVSVWKDHEHRDLVDHEGHPRLTLGASELTASAVFQPMTGDDVEHIDLTLARRAVHSVLGRIVEADGVANRRYELLVGPSAAPIRTRLPWHEVLEDGSFCVVGFESNTCELAVRALAVQPNATPAFYVFKDVPADAEPVELRLPSEPGVRVEISVAGTNARLRSILVVACLPDVRGASEFSTAAELTVVESTTRWPPGVGWAGSLSQSFSDASGCNYASLVDAPDGRATMALTLGAPGVYAVGIVADGADGPGFPMATPLLDFAAGVHRIEFRPVPTGSLSGIVSGGVGRGSLSVWLVDRAGDVQPFALGSGEKLQRARSLDARGRFLLPSVPVGAYRLRVGTEAERDAGTYRREVVVGVEAGKNTTIEFGP